MGGIDACCPGTRRKVQVKKISAAVIAYNEESKIDRALASLQDLCDEIVVVDSFSTDATVERCRRYTDRIEQRAWPGYRDQKQYATDQATHDWILSLDADEEVGAELRGEIRRWKQNATVTDCNGYYISRKAFLLGRAIHHTTWYPDWQLRLFRKSRGRWEGGRVHESFKVQPPTSRLRGDLYHYTYTSVNEYLEQLSRFSSLAAADSLDRGQRSGFPQLVFRPLAAFFSNYLLRRGFLDGSAGFTVSVLAAVSTFFKYLKLWQLQSKDRQSPFGPSG